MYSFVEIFFPFFHRWSSSSSSLCNIIALEIEILTVSNSYLIVNRSVFLNFWWRLIDHSTIIFEYLPQCLHQIDLNLLMKKARATHSSTLAWKIPCSEEPGRLQSKGFKESDTTERLHFHFSLSCIGEGNGNPFQCSCLENPRDGGAWWAAVYGIAQSRTALKRLSSMGTKDLCEKGK